MDENVLLGNRLISMHYARSKEVPPGVGENLDAMAAYLYELVKDHTRDGVYKKAGIKAGLIAAYNLARLP